MIRVEYIGVVGLELQVSYEIMRCESKVCRVAKWVDIVVSNDAFRLSMDGQSVQPKCCRFVFQVRRRRD